MFETHRVLVEQRRAELLREAEARRLQTGYALKESRVLRTPLGRLVSVLRRSHVMLIGHRGSTTRAPAKPPRSQLDP